MSQSNTYEKNMGGHLGLTRGIIWGAWVTSPWEGHCEVLLASSSLMLAKARCNIGVTKSSKKLLAFVRE